MNSIQLHDLFRLEVFDTVTPYFWSDAEIYQYMDEAQKMLTRLGGGIPDGTTDAVTLLSVTAGDTWANEHASILKIRSATRQSDFKDLQILNFEDLQGGLSASDSDYGQHNRLKLDAVVGDMSYIVVGITEGKIRLLRRPAANDSIRLIVDRMPIVDIVVPDTNTPVAQQFEIRQEHVVNLLPWMKHRAYSKQDSETFDKGKSDEFESKFRSYCHTVKEEKERRQHKYRSMQYGGI